MTPDTHPSTWVGHRIGAYDIVAELGSGGMGEVFAAVRADGQYEQRVALKLVRGGLATAGIVERFRGERQILAGLDHPYIARLFETPLGHKMLGGAAFSMSLGIYIMQKMARFEI